MQILPDVFNVCLLDCVSLHVCVCVCCHIAHIFGP